MITCGAVVCYDENSYCCLDDDYEDSCCVALSYYETWWFWFMWVIFMICFISCFAFCFRACGRRRGHYVIFGEPQQPPVYGSVTANPPGSVTVSAPVLPSEPPAYVPYPQEKPPAYAAAPQPQTKAV